MAEQIQKLYIEATSACNLSCSMCFRHGWIDEKIGTMASDVVDQLLATSQNLPELRQVMFSGMGEPLLHPRVGEMIASFHNRGIRTELLTNGTMLTQGRIQMLMDSGLDMLWVSVDGFDRKSYEKVHIGSRFDLITQNLDAFNELRRSCELGITFVIMKDNVNEIAHINKFADRYGVDMINLSYAIPGEPIAKEDVLYDGPYAVGKQRRVSFDNFANTPKDYCPFIEENGCFVKWNGDVVPCMQLLHSSYTYLYEEKRKVHYKNFGNIMDQDIQCIWTGEEYADFRRRVRGFEFSDCTYCMGCEDRLENITDCCYSPFPTCGACLWAQGVARCP